jgi:hypothetical protein
LRDAWADAAEAGFVTIAGSLYLIGEAIELLQPCAGKNINERALNEWGSVGEPMLPAAPR